MANKAISILRQVKYVENIHIEKRIKLCKTLELTVLEYACTVRQCADSTKLEGVQRKGLAKF